MSAGVAALGMYPFPDLRGHWETWWAAVRAHLAELPDAPDAPDALTWDGEPREHWRSPALVLGMTCGWPLVTELGGVVDVVGAFDVDVPFAVDGHYRSVLVASKPRSFGEWREAGGAIAAVNGRDSLSGWVSLCNAWGGEPEAVMVTGAHVESLRAVAAGVAQVASIDAVSFAHAVRAEPALGAVHVVGHGPRVPCLPLVTAGGRRRVPALRAAITAAMAEPALRPTCAALLLRGFVPFERTAYDVVRSLSR